MDTVASVGPVSEVPAGSLETLVSDLTDVLADGNALYFSLEPKGVVLSVKAPEVFAFGDSIGGRWARMSPRQRAEFVLQWIRRAAKYTRKPKVPRPFPEGMVVESSA